MLAGLAGRVATAGVGFITVPLTLRLLNRDNYGLYATISGVVAWLQISNLGVAKGLTNLLIDCHARDDRDAARRAVASLWTGVGLILLAVVVIGFAVSPFVNWPGVFSVTDPSVAAQIRPTVAALFITTLLGLGFSPLSTILSAYQDERKAVAWNLARTLIMPAAVLFALRRHGGMADLALATMVLTAVLSVSNALWLFGRDKAFLRPRWDDVSMALLRRIVRSSGAFFLIDVSILLVFQIDRYLILRLAGPGEVTEYELATRLYMLAYSVYLLVQGPLWAAMGEALKKRDVQWTRVVLRRVSTISVGAMTLIAVALTVGGRTVIRLWTGRTDAVPSQLLLALVGLYFIVRVWTEIYSILLFSLDQHREMIPSSLLHGVTTLGLGILFGRAWGLTGIVAANTLSFLLTASWWVPWRARIHLRRREALPS